MFAASNTATTKPNISIGGPGSGSGLFGVSSSTPQSTPGPGSNMFQQPNTINKPTGLFGNPAMSTPSPASNNLFSKPAATSTTGGLFGASTVNSTNPTSNSLFSKPTTGGLFGATSQAAAPASSTSLFSKPSTGLFGASSSTQPTAPTQGGGLFGNSVSNIGNTATNTGYTGIGTEQNAYGLVIDNSINGNVMPPALTSSEKPTKTTHTMIGTGRYHSPRATSSLLSKLSSRFSSYSKSDTAEGIFFPKHKNAHGLEKQSVLVGTSSKSNKGLVSKKDFSNMRKLKIDKKRIDSKKQKLFQELHKFAKTSEVSVESGDNLFSKAEHNTVNIIDLNSDHVSETEYAQLDEELNDEVDDEAVEESLDPEIDSSGYWCFPTVADLEKMSEKEMTMVNDFVIGRKGYGTIMFNYDVDLSAFADNLEDSLFGKVVIFHKNRTVEVYPDEDNKPSVGNGMNVPATITLESIYPAGHNPKEELKELGSFVKKLKNQPSSDFISYNPFGGIWVFKVKHFSIYGLVDENENNTFSNRHVKLPIPGTFDTGAYVQQTPKVDSNVQFLTSPFASEELESIVENPDVINEMDYEPSDVEEEDLEDLEKESDLSVSNDLVEQLRLVNSSEKSIFNKKSLRTYDNLDNLLFTTFNAKVEKHKEIVKQRRLENKPNFAHFNKNSTINLKSPASSNSGSRVVGLPLAKSDEFLMNIFVDIIPRTEFKTRSSNDFPKISSIGFEFKNLVKIQPTEQKWKLLSILFDRVKIKEPVENEKVKTYLISKEKSQKLTKWVNAYVKTDLTELINKSNNPLEKIYYHLIQKNTVEATKLCMSSKNAHLAAMIAMSCSNDFRFKNLAKLQLSKWETMGYPVDPNIVKIYKIFAHQISFDSELHWLINFAAYINYADLSTQTLEQEVEFFFKQTSSQLKSDLIEVNIFKLFYSIPKGEQNQVLMNCKFESNPLDFVIPWFIVQILSLKNMINVDVTQKDIFTLNFIEQLKINGLFEECVYVTTFIENETLAKEQFKSTIRTNIQKFEENINYLIKLRIPEHEIYYSLALLYKNKHDFLKESEFYLRAKRYNDAIKVVTEQLGPKLLLQHSVDDEKTLAKVISEFPVACKTTQWNESVGVYDLYLQYKGSGDASILRELIKYVQAFAKANSHLVECRAILTVICEYVILEFLKTSKTLDPTLKQTLLSLPMGEAETKYTHRLLNSM